LILVPARWSRVLITTGRLIHAVANLPAAGSVCSGAIGACAVGCTGITALAAEIGFRIGIAGAFSIQARPASALGIVKRPVSTAIASAEIVGPTVEAVVSYSAHGLPPVSFVIPPGGLSRQSAEAGHHVGLNLIQAIEKVAMLLDHHAGEFTNLAAFGLSLAKLRHGDLFGVS